MTCSIRISLNFGSDNFIFRDMNVQSWHFVRKSTKNYIYKNSIRVLCLFWDSIIWIIKAQGRILKYEFKKQLFKFKRIILKSGFIILIIWDTVTQSRHLLKIGLNSKSYEIPTLNVHVSVNKIVRSKIQTDSDRTGHQN